jgi:5-methylthioadenosine/S-adenosylhomocysteine deaminase
MHLAALIHKGLAKDPTVLPAREVLAMASKNGATALGRIDTGAVEVGMKADLCAVDLDRPHLVPVLDYPNLLVYSAHASDVIMTMVDGRVLYDRGDFTTIDAEKVRFDFTAALRRLGLA